jgi:hypothetical protein
MDHRFSADDFRRCVALLERKLGDVATNAGVPEAECLDLERSLAALPSMARSRATAMLYGVQAQAADDYPAMAAAARYVLVGGGGREEAQRPTPMRHHAVWIGLEYLLELFRRRLIPERMLELHGVVEGDLRFRAARYGEVHLAQHPMVLIMLGFGW